MADALKKVEPERKCWRLVGGVLVEQVVGEVIPELETQGKQMEALLEQLFARIKETETELRGLEQELGIKVNVPQAKQDTAAKSSGVLVE